MGIASIQWCGILWISLNQYPILAHPILISSAIKRFDKSMSWQPLWWPLFHYVIVTTSVSLPGVSWPKWSTASSVARMPGRSSERPKARIASMVWWKVSSWRNLGHAPWLCTLFQGYKSLESDLGHFDETPKVLTDVGFQVKALRPLQIVERFYLESQDWDECSFICQASGLLNTENRTTDTSYHFLHPARVCQGAVKEASTSCSTMPERISQLPEETAAIIW